MNAGAPFGQAPSTKGEHAKELIFPRLTESQDEGDELYKKSHGTWGVGEQRCRNYTWRKDPTTCVFGAKGKDIAFNGVSKNIADALTTSEEERGPMVVTRNVSCTLLREALCDGTDSLTCCGYVVRWRITKIWATCWESLEISESELSASQKELYSGNRPFLPMRLICGAPPRPSQESMAVIAMTVLL
jgi:hypothetical protein